MPVVILEYRILMPGNCQGALSQARMDNLSVAVRVARECREYISSQRILSADGAELLNTAQLHAAIKET